VVGRFIVRLIRHSKRISLVKLRSTKGVNAGLVIGILYKASRLARTLMRLALARGDLSDAGRPGGLYGIDFEWPEPVYTILGDLDNDQFWFESGFDPFLAALLAQEKRFVPPAKLSL